MIKIFETNREGYHDKGNSCSKEHEQDDKIGEENNAFPRIKTKYKKENKKREKPYHKCPE